MAGMFIAITNYKQDLQTIQTTEIERGLIGFRSLLCPKMHPCLYILLRI